MSLTPDQARRVALLEVSVRDLREDALKICPPSAELYAALAGLMQFLKMATGTIVDYPNDLPFPAPGEPPWAPLPADDIPPAT